MDIHDDQAKEILANFGVPVPRRGIAFTNGQADTAGKRIDHVRVEEATQIDRELYLGFVPDRTSERTMIIASANGGAEMEDLAAADPESLIRMIIDPAVGLTGYQARDLAFKLGLEGDQIAQMVTVLKACDRACRDLDTMKVEINPLAVRTDGALVALGATMSFDTNALFHRGRVAALRDPVREDPRESFAHDHGLANVALDGDIGCITNGAGLAMASMDMIQLAGGAPAHFEDIGDEASSERVCQALCSVSSDPKVSVILVNIFAGINRSDWVAEGVIKAAKEAGVEIPVVVRLSGANVDAGRQRIAQSGLPIVSADTLADAARAAVAARAQAIAAE